MSQPLVLVTGVTGFIAGHVTLQLLEQGYRVRGTARGSKIGRLASVSLPGLEFTEVNDLASADLTEALKDVEIIMHVAAPLPGRTSVEDTINSAVEGTLNIVRQAERAGIRKMVVTATFGNVLHPSMAPAFTGATFTDADWGTTSREEILKRAEDPFHTYFASKNLAERALWDFAKSHPHVDITTILPGFVYGPFARGLPLPAGKSELGSNLIAYNLITGHYPGVFPPWTVDVRDVATAHVRVLSVGKSAPPAAPKRFLVNGGNVLWGDIAARLVRAPRAGAVIAPLDGFERLPGPASALDTTRAERELGMVFRDPVKAVEDAVDDLLELKRGWEAVRVRN